MQLVPNVLDMYPQYRENPDPRTNLQPRYLPSMVREMGAESPSIGMPCFHYHVPHLYRICVFHVLGHWPACSCCEGIYNFHFTYMRSQGWQC